MTGTEVIAFFENIIDDTVDRDLEIDLLIHAKDKVEMDRDWEQLKAFDTSESTASGENADTGHDFPDDFFAPIPQQALYVGTQEYRAVPKEQMAVFKDRGNFFFYDFALRKYFLCGTFTTVQPITFNYIKGSLDWTADDADPDTLTDVSVLEWVFPKKFHKLLAFEMAELWQSGLDADDIAFRMSAAQGRQKKELWDGLIDWDARLKIAALNASSKILPDQYGQPADHVREYDY